jgi:hypothetical protein
VKQKLFVFVAALALPALIAPVASAEKRWHIGSAFEDFLPAEPDEYFFDDGYLHEDVPESPLVTEGSISIYDYDERYYEPTYVPSVKRIDKVRAGLRAANAKKAAKASVDVGVKVAVDMAVDEGQPTKRVKSAQKPMKIAAAKTADKIVSSKPKASLVLKPIPESSSAAVTCDKGATIVAGFGFADVKPKTCTGDVYAFNATRGGKAYEVLLSAKNGALTEVKRQ